MSDSGTQEGLPRQDRDGEARPAGRRDAEGRNTAFATLFPGKLAQASLPLGLAHNRKLVGPVKKGQSLTSEHAAIDSALSAY